MIRQVKDEAEWDGLVESNNGHPLQLWNWGVLKESHGPWRACRLVVEKDGLVLGGAQVLRRDIPPFFGQFFYIPRGPFCSDFNRDKVLQELVNWAKSEHALGLKVEPDWDSKSDWPEGWRKSKNRILVPKTAILDLNLDQDSLLAHATKKTRQYIRKSTAEGIVVRKIKMPDDVDKCLEIYRETVERAGFAIHKASYYQDLAKLAGEANRIYLAEKDGKQLSFLWNLRTPAVEFELYGGVNEEGQRLRSNYVLKWQAILDAKDSGIGKYDMNGLLNDGISGFKRGFSDKEINLVGAWDFPLSPLYGVWEFGLPLAKGLVQSANRLRRKS